MSGRIPDNQIREVVERSDMLQIVGDVVELRRAGTSYKGLCPFHTEKTPSFHVNPGLKLYHCYGCGAGGDAIRFVRETRGLSFVEAVEFLADRAGLTLEREADDPAQARQRAQERSERQRLLELARIVQQFFRSRFDLPVGLAARRYADSRRLGPEIAARYGLGASGTGWSDLCDHCKRLGWGDRDLLQLGVASARDSGGVYDRFRNRLMFPIFNAQGDLVGFGGRTVADPPDDAKYINSPEVTLGSEQEGSRFKYFYKKGDTVFGLWQAREAIRQSGYAILVEGNLDVMTLAQAGFRNAVCAMGTALTEQQVAALRRFAEKVVLVYDGDKAGRAAAMKAAPLLIGAGFDGKLVLMPDGEDPDSLVRDHGPQALQQRIDTAAPLLNAYLDNLLGEWDGSIQGRVKILQAAGPLLAVMSSRDPTARDLAYDYLVGRLAKDETLERGRAQYGRYLDRSMQAAPAAKAEAPLPDPTYGEQPVATRDQQLLEILIWYPVFLPQAEQSGVLDCIDSTTVRLALRDLCAHGRDHHLELDEVSRWAQQLSDGAMRRLVLDRLMAAVTVPAAAAAAEFEKRATLVLTEHLKDQFDEATQALQSTPQSAAHWPELYGRWQKLSAEMRRVQKGRGQSAAARSA